MMQPSLRHLLEPRIQRAPTEAPPEAAPAPAGLPRFLTEAEPDAGPADAGPAPTDAGGGLPGGVPAPPLPTGPDACSTAEEEERKTKFRARSFSALNFRPSAGYGQFDAYYWPASSLMAAIVKMKFTFVEAINTPPPETLLSMWMSGQDIMQFFWTEAQKTQFSEEYRDRVATRWSFAHTFRSKKPCWPFTASPYIAPRVVGDAADAHFDVTVRKGSGGSSFNAENPGTPGWRGTGKIDEQDNQEKANFNSRSVARSERQRLQRAIAAATASPILFPKDSAVIQPADLTTLRTEPDDHEHSQLPAADRATSRRLQATRSQHRCPGRERHGPSIPHQREGYRHAPAADRCRGNRRRRGGRTLDDAAGR